MSLAASAANDAHARIRRPRTEPETAIRFYPIESTYRVARDGSGTHAYLFGADECGDTVGARIDNFRPYLFVRVDNDACADDVTEFVDALEHALGVVVQQPHANATLRVVQSRHSRLIVAHTLVDARAIRTRGPKRGHQGVGTERFVRLDCYAPGVVPLVRALLEADYSQLHADISRHDLARHLVDAATSLRRRGNEPPVAPPAKRQRTGGALQSNVDPNDSDDDDDDADANPWNDPNVVMRAHAPAEDDDVLVRERKTPIDVDSTPLLRSALAGLRVCGGLDVALRYREVFEADFDYVLRLYTDCGIRACECVELVDAHERPLNAQLGRASAREFAVDYHALRRVDDDAIQNAIWPMSVASIDCEMEIGPSGRFPLPSSERVLCVCVAVADPTSSSMDATLSNVAFSLRAIDCDEQQRRRFTHVLEFGGDERAMLEALSVFLRELRPHFITGWNVEAFDLTYLLERAEVLGVEFARLSCRMPGERARAVDCSFSSSAHGTHDSKEVRGLSIIDMLPYFQRNYNMRSYTLDAVSNERLNESKEKVGYDQINALETSARGRATLAVYCMKDALLPLRLMAHDRIIVGLVELSRIACVPIDMLVRRGQQIRLKALFYRAGAEQATRHVFATRTDADRRASEGDTYEGAYVIEPEIGFYTIPIVVLDFASLYPSIISAANMCPTTLLPADDRAARKHTHDLERDTDVWRAWVCGVKGDLADQPEFIRYTRLPGLIPAVLRSLLTRRIGAKEARDAALERGDALTAAIMDKRQLALKVMMNAIYGAFGAPTSAFYCPEIAAMVTAIGRWMLNEAKRLVEKLFTRARGYPFDAHTIYGDTDSIFVRTSNEVDAEASARFGIEMAAMLTTYFRERFGTAASNIVRMLFEKTFIRYIMYKKKRYAGWKYTLQPDGKTMVCGKRPAASGMASERRDTCLLVAEGVRDVVALLLDKELSRAAVLERVRAFISEQLVGALQSGRVNWSRIIQSKQFRKRAADYANVPIHIQLAAKLERRHGAHAPETPHPGARIPYVVLRGASAADKLAARGESPDYAWTHALPLDIDYYVERGVHTTMARVLTPLLAPRAEHKNEARRAYDAFLAERPAKRQRRALDVSVGLFGGALVRKFRCKLCSCVSETVICARHTPDERARYEATSDTKRRRLAAERVELLATCTKCRASNVVDIEDSLETANPCSSNACVQYWERRMNDRLCH